MSRFALVLTLLPLGCAGGGVCLGGAKGCDTAGDTGSAPTADSDSSGSDQDTGSDSGDTSAPSDSPDTSGEPAEDTVTEDTSSPGLYAELMGPSSDSYAGAALAALGDEDGDGIPDLGVGAPDASFGPTEVGTAFVVSGAALSDGSQTLSAALGADVPGSTPAIYVGGSMDGPGDMDADGYTELLLGVSAATVSFRHEGITYLFRGPLSGTIHLSDADLAIPGGSASLSTGQVVGGATDPRDGGIAISISGLGGGAVAVVSPDDPPAALSDASVLLGGGPSWDCFGCALSAGADVNGDGIPDLWAGASMGSFGGVASGVAYLYLGPLHGARGLGDADAIVGGDQDGSRFGAALLGDVDFDGDGYPDPVIGADQEGSREVGLAALFAGPLSGTLALGDATATVKGDFAYGEVGTSLAGCDLHGDGSPDLAVGAPNYIWLGAGTEDGAGEGAVALVSAPFAGTLDFADAPVVLSPPSKGDWYGYALACAGDLRGVGMADLAIGAPETDGAGSYPGAAMILGVDAP